MKRITFLFATFYLLSSYCASGQKIHITDTSNHWLTKQLHPTGGAGPALVTYDDFSLGGTVMGTNGHTYNVLKTNNNDSFLIREDSNRVFLRAFKSMYKYGISFTNTADEFLYFDYNLQSGDTLTIPVGDMVTSASFSQYVVLSIDSLLINNLWHKNFQMKSVSGQVYNFYFTEGIGTQWGPIILSDYIILAQFLPSLICFQNNGTAPLASLSNCDHATSLNEINASEQQYFNLYPNPANEEFTIEYSGAKTADYNVSISDVIGRTLLKTLFQSKKKLNISNLISGIYIVQIADENEVLFREKIIVSK